VKEGAAPVARKIIYTANVDLVVDDFDKAVEEVHKLMTAHAAYVARSEVRGSPGVPRSGTWTIRVPVDSFPDFVNAVAGLGELRRNATDSEDITDKFYDLAARIKNDEAEEAALRKLLEKASDKDVLLALRKELRAIRGEIEQQKGQLERWSKETQLATVNLTLVDRKDYVAPLAPSFGGAIGRTFEGSVEAMLSVGKGLVLAAVALAPWLVPLGILALVARVAWRRYRPRRVANAITVVPDAEGGGPAPG
jgi:hypothetical protein